jgi:ureidoglycolate hydrolase
MTPYIYIVVRNDLKKEHQLVQACHSTLESGLTFDRPKEGVIHLVVLEVNSEDELFLVASKLKDQEVDYVMFEESWGGIGFSSLATRPIPKQEEGVLRILPLLTY